MTQAEQAAFVRHCYETQYRTLEQAGSKEGMVRPTVPAVPADMRTGLADERGWPQWKLIPSPVTAEELDALEREFGLRFPSLLRTALSTCCHFFGNGYFTQRSDQPLEDFSGTMRDPVLFQAWLLPFAWWSGESGGSFLRCIDLANMPEEDRCPVVQIDDMKFFDLSQSGAPISREDLLPLLEPVADNFKDYMEQLFLLPEKEC